MLKHLFFEYKIIPNVLFAIQFGTIFLSRMPQYEGVHFLYLQFVLAVYSYWLIYKDNKKSIILNKYLNILKTYAICFILSYVFIGNAHIREVVNGVILMPVIPLLLYYYRISTNVILLLFFIVTGYIIAVVVTGSINIDEVTYNSGNFLSFYAMLYSYPYYVMCYYEKKEPLIVVPLITLFVALLALGRGGIIASSLLLLFQLFNKLNTPGRVRYIYISIIALVLVLIYKVGFSDTISDFLDTATTKFEAYGMDTRGRSESYKYYFNALCNPLYILTGAPIKEIPYIYNNLEGSIHNPWLTLHSRIGIYVIWILVFVISGIRRIYKLKNYYVLAIIFCLLIAGFSNSDIAGVMVGGDSYLFFIIIMYLENKYNFNHKFYN